MMEMRHGNETESASRAGPSVARPSPVNCVVDISCE